MIRMSYVCCESLAQRRDHLLYLTNRPLTIMQLFHFLTEKPDILPGHYHLGTPEGAGEVSNLPSVDTTGGDPTKSPMRKKKRTGSFIILAP